MSDTTRCHSTSHHHRRLPIDLLLLLLLFGRHGHSRSHSSRTYTR